MNKKIIGILVMTLLIAIVFQVTAYKETAAHTNINIPPIADAGGPYEGVEGVEIMFDASNSWDPDGDQLTYRWDFDCDEIWDTDWSDNPITLYSYCDDYEYYAVVGVSDGTSSTYDTAMTTVENVQPVVDVGSDVSIDEGSTLSLSWSFNDSGLCDTHVYCVNGLPCKPGPYPEKPIPPRFKITSYVPDEFFQQWLWNINIESWGIYYNDLEFMVMNYPPDGDLGLSGFIFPMDPSVEYVVNNPNHVKVNLSSWPGQNYDFAIYTNVPDAQIRWWTTLDGEIVTTGEMGVPNHKYSYFSNSVEHVFEVTFLDNREHFIDIAVMDDEGDQNNDSCIINVLNTPPIIEPFGPFKGSVNIPFEISAFVSDAGADDLSFFWEFGDGESASNVYYNQEEGPDNEEFPWRGIAPFNITDSINHTYNEEDQFTIKLTVEDDDGGKSEYTTTASTPKNKVINSPFLQFLENHPHLFPMLRQLMGL